VFLFILYEAFNTEHVSSQQNISKRIEEYLVKMLNHLRKITQNLINDIHHLRRVVWQQRPFVEYRTMLYCQREKLEKNV
jgi:hypothetical protein